jgi:hypothetical protein
MHTGCWLRKMTEKMLKTNKCRLEGNTKMNIIEKERVFHSPTDALFINL